MSTASKYELEKAIWTNADFDVMGWHDSVIWGMAIVADDFELMFDIDYIFQWVNPVPPEQFFRFWVAPATLVFHGVQHIRMNMDLQYIQLIEVADIHREGPIASPDGSLTNWSWKVELQQGDIEFEATGFTQYVRKAPAFADLQNLSLSGRGGLSFGREFN
jgi:hypothetical protein